MPQLAPFMLWFPLVFMLVVPFILTKKANPIKLVKCISSMLNAGHWSSS